MRSGRDECLSVVRWLCTRMCGRLRVCVCVVVFACVSVWCVRRLWVFFMCVCVCLPSPVRLWLCASRRVCVCVSVFAHASWCPCAFLRACVGITSCGIAPGWGWLHASPPPDQLFGILARAITVMDCILDPDDIARVIHSVFRQPALQSFLKHSEVSVQRLRVVRDWQSWHNHLRLELKGGLLVDSTATHFFLFAKRSSPVLRPLSKSCVRVMGRGVGLCVQQRFEQSGSTSRSP